MFEELALAITPMPLVPISLYPSPSSKSLCSSTFMNHLINNVTQNGFYFRYALSPVLNLSVILVVDETIIYPNSRICKIITYISTLYTYGRYHFYSYKEREIKMYKYWKGRNKIMLLANDIHSGIHRKSLHNIIYKKIVKTN